jgi:F0F1-type ATP synthase assembly protein I
MFALVKVIVSAVLISVITEVAKIYPKFGGMIAALPLVSLLSLCWLYVQGEETQHLSKFVFGVLWGFPATAFLLLVTALCLKASFSFILSIVLGIGGWGIFLLMQNIILKNV